MTQGVKIRKSSKLILLTYFLKDLIATVLRIQIRWIRKILAFLDPDPNLQKYADPRIRIQGAKYQPKTAKNLNLLSKPKS